MKAAQRSPALCMVCAVEAASRATKHHCSDDTPQLLPLAKLKRFTGGARRFGRSKLAWPRLPSKQGSR